MSSDIAALCAEARQLRDNIDNGERVITGTDVIEMLDTLTPALESTERAREEAVEDCDRWKAAYDLNVSEYHRIRSEMKLKIDEPIVASFNAMTAELTAARAFSRDILATFWEPHCFNEPDGGSVQDIAEKHGLLIPFTATEPCGENCNCAEWDKFPQTCYRAAEWLRDTAAGGEEGR